MFQKIFVIITLSIIPALAQPTVTSTTIDGIGHSVARVTWTTNSSAFQIGRVRYGTTTSYEGSPLGGIQTLAGNVCHSDPVKCPGVNQQDLGISGLAGNTLYHVCAQSSVDNGVTWSACVDATFTTGSIPIPDPAKPTAPITFSTAYPNTAGCNTATVTSFATLTSAVNTAQTNRFNSNVCTVISMAPGLIDTTSATGLQPNIDPSALPFTAGNVNTSTNTITITAHGLVANQQIKFAVPSGSCLATWNCSAGLPQLSNGALVQGAIVYVINPTTNTFQISATSGGSAIALNTTGSGTNYVVPVPAANAPQIIIQTTGTLPPDGTRLCGSSACVSNSFGSLVNSSAQLAALKINGGLWSSVNGSAGPLIFQTNIGTHHIRFVGIEMTHTDASSLAATSTDPRPTYGLFYTNVADAPDHIIIDRCYIHGLGQPNRLYRPIIDYDGTNMAIINSDLDQWDFWRPWLDSGTPGTRGFGTSIASNTVTITTSGATYHMGSQIGNCTAANLSVTFTSGTISGTNIAKSYFSTNCTPTFVIPTGMTATCTGTGSLNGGANQNCAINTVASPDYVRDANGGYGCGPIAGITLTSGVPTTAGNEYGYGASIYITEGTQGFIAGWGPGPFQIYNNYSEGAGLLWHWDDSSNGESVPSNIVVQRNTFFMDQKHVTGGVSSDGFDYEQRNGPEWKDGANVLITGNTFKGFFAGVSATGFAVGLDPVNCNCAVTDFEISYNTFQGGAASISAALVPSNMRGATPDQHLYVHDNLEINANGWTQFSAVSRTSAGASNFFPVGYAREDIIVDHNTIFNHAGPDNTWWHLIGNPLEGVSWTNNILWYSGDFPSYGLSQESMSGNGQSPSCTGVAKALADCAFTNGAGNTSYKFAGNLFVPFYTNSQNSTGVVDAQTFCNNWGGGTFIAPTNCPSLINQGGQNYMRGDSTTAARQSNIMFTSTSNVPLGFKLQPGPGGSPYAAGNSSPATDGLDIGANIAALATAQGIPIPGTIQSGLTIISGQTVH